MDQTSKDFIEYLLELTNTVESPEIYIRWGGYLAVCTVMRDHAWVDFHDRQSKMFPNMYLLIIGDSGRLRKSTPLKIMNSLIKRISNTKIIEGYASIQGIIKKLATIETLSNGLKLEGASGVVYSEEFAASLVGDGQTLKVLTDIYDYHKERAVTLKTEEPTILRNVVVNLITATNMSFLSTMFTLVDLKGGFVGRAIIIIGSRPRPRNLGLNGSKNIEAWNWLEHRLREITKIRGAIYFAWDCENYFEAWYDLDDVEDSSDTGFGARIHTHSIKLSIVKSASSGVFHNTLSSEFIEFSVEEIVDLRFNYQRILTGSISIGNNVVNTVNHIIGVFLIQKTLKEKIEHGELVRRCLQIADLSTFDSAMNTLKSGDIISFEARNGSTYYAFTSRALAIYGHATEEKAKITKVVRD